MRHLFGGATYPLRALALIRANRELWGFVVWPILLNLVIGATIYAALLFAGLRAIEAWSASFPEWLQAARIVLQLLLIVALLAATGFVLVRFGVVLGSPFYSRLSERLEVIATGTPPPNWSAGVAGVAQDLFRALFFELKKLLLFGVVGLTLLALNFVPVAGQLLATAGWIALGATIACLDFFDQPLERRRLRFRDKLGYIRRTFPASAAFGLVSFGLVSIPLVNLLSIPLCVTAGTLFYCDRPVGQVPRERR